MRHALLLALLLSLPSATTLFAPVARADTEDRALALDLFEQGRALLRKGDYQAALTKFEAASRVMRTFGILLNMAECHEKLGRTASAWATWREARAVASEAHRADDEAMATEREKALEPGLSRLTISVPSVADAAELEIRRDGVPVPRAAWGVGIPVDPGAHVLEERAPGRRPRKIELVVQPNGSAATVTMNPLEAEPPPAAPMPPPPPVAGPGPAPSAVLVAPPPPVEPSPPEPAPQPQDSGTGQRIAGWVLGGLGLAGAGTGIAVALAGQNQHNEAVASQVAGHPGLATTEESNANSTKTIGYATIGGGGAFLASGIILLLTAHSAPRSSPSTVLLTPWISPTCGGAAFSTVW